MWVIWERETAMYKLCPFWATLTSVTRGISSTILYLEEVNPKSNLYSWVWVSSSIFEEKYWRICGHTLNHLNAPAPLLSPVPSAQNDISHTSINQSDYTWLSRLSLTVTSSKMPKLFPFFYSHIFIIYCFFIIDKCSCIPSQSLSTSALQTHYR